MSYYNITLLVTFEQEDAIVGLFRSRSWAYLKTGKYKFPLPLGALDRLRYFIVALLGTSI